MGKTVTIVFYYSIARPIFVCTRSSIIPLLDSSVSSEFSVPSVSSHASPTIPPSPEGIPTDGFPALSPCRAFNVWEEAATCDSGGEIKTQFPRPGTRRARSLAKVAAVVLHRIDRIASFGVSLCHVFLHVHRLVHPCEPRRPTH